jgi:hypothetical protein
MSEFPKPEQTRRPGIPTVPIILADGRAWGFARPTLRLMPIVAPRKDDLGRHTETITVRATSGYPLEIERLLDALRSALGGGSEVTQYEAFFRLAAALLRRAHDIDLTTAAALLAVDAAELPRIVAEVLAVAFGGPSSATTSSAEEIKYE